MFFKITVVISTVILAKQTCKCDIMQQYHFIQATLPYNSKIRSHSKKINELHNTASSTTSILCLSALFSLCRFAPHPQCIWSSASVLCTCANSHMPKCQVTSTQHLNCDLEGWSKIDTATCLKLCRKLPGAEWRTWLKFSPRFL